MMKWMHDIDSIHKCIFFIPVSRNCEDYFSVNFVLCYLL